MPLTPGALGRQRGDALASIVDDVDSVLDRELRVRLPVRGALLVSLLATAVATAVLPAAGLVVGATCALAAAAAYGIAWAGSGRPEVDAVRLRAQLSARVVECLQLAPELVMWQARERTTDDVVRIGRTLAEASGRSQRALGLARAVALVVCAAGVVGTGLAGAGPTAALTLSGPLLALLTLLPLALADVLVPLAEAGATSRRTSAAEARLAALEAQSPLALEPASPAPLPASHALRASGLCAGWGDQPVFEDLDMDLRPGRRLGVVGPSGSGKSTLAAALLRFVDPLDGTVALGEVPLDHLALDDVRRTIGLVDDDPHVFATSVAENVRLARPTAGDAEVEEALVRAHLGDWLDTLPDGLATWLGDGHAQVSGGERARIAVARSLLADSPVLVLDEPTAHLDHATATLVAADLLDATSGRTVVWITHADVGLDRMDEVLDLGA